MTVKIVIDWSCDEPSCLVSCFNDLAAFDGGLEVALRAFADGGHEALRVVAPKSWKWVDGKLLCPWHLPKESK